MTRGHYSGHSQQRPTMMTTENPLEQGTQQSSLGDLP